MLRNVSNPSQLHNYEDPEESELFEVIEVDYSSDEEEDRESEPDSLKHDSDILRGEKEVVESLSPARMAVQEEPSSAREVTNQQVIQVLQGLQGSMEKMTQLLTLLVQSSNREEHKDLDKTEE